MGAERTRATEQERPTTSDAPSEVRWRRSPAPTIRLGATDDCFERDADDIARRVAEAVHAGPPEPGRVTVPLGRVAPAGVQRTARGNSADDGSVDADTSRRIQRARSGGTPLASPVRRRMETAFGADLSAVRLHEGRESTQLNDRIDARAFTIGQDVFFRDGVPDTSRPDGTELLAHELTHTLQQTGPSNGGAERLQRRGKGKKSRKATKGSRRHPAGKRQQQRRPRPRTAPPAPVVVPSASSALTRFAPLIDLAVPAPGDSGGLEFAAKVPLDATGSTFLQFDFSGEAERDTENVEVGLEVAVGYGGAASLPFGLTPEIIGKLGGSVTAKATNSSEVLTLISYAFYRTFRESSSVPREAADYLWGQGGTTGATSADESEQWGADIEQQIFAANPDAEVSVGSSLGLEAVLGLDDDGDDEFGVDVSIASATKYSKESLEQSGAGGASQLGKAGKERHTDGWTPWLASWVGMQRGAQKTVGEVERTLELSTEISSGGLAGEAELEVALQRELQFSFELSGTRELGAAERRPERIAELIVPWVASARRVVDFLRSHERTLSQYAGSLGDAADTIGGVIDGYATRQGELAELLAGKIGGSGTRSVKVSVTIEREGGETTTELTIAYVSAVESGGELLGFGAEASAERERKLVTISWP